MTMEERAEMAAELKHTGKVLCECDDCVRNGVKSLMEVIQF